MFSNFSRHETPSLLQNILRRYKGQLWPCMWNYRTTKYQWLKQFIRLSLKRANNKLVGILHIISWYIIYSSLLIWCLINKKLNTEKVTKNISHSNPEHYTACSGYFNVKRKRKGMHQINQSPMQAPYPIRAHKLICAEKRYRRPPPL